MIAVPPSATTLSGAAPLPAEGMDERDIIFSAGIWLSDLQV
jgi:hypothetical protein